MLMSSNNLTDRHLPDTKFFQYKSFFTTECQSAKWFPIKKRGTNVTACPVKVEGENLEQKTNNKNY